MQTVNRARARARGLEGTHMYGQLPTRAITFMCVGFVTGRRRHSIGNFQASTERLANRASNNRCRFINTA